VSLTNSLTKIYNVLYSQSYGMKIEICSDFMTTFIHKLDFAFNMFFLLYFIIRVSCRFAVFDNIDYISILLVY
jgi:hypothetical protein